MTILLAPIEDTPYVGGTGNSYITVDVNGLQVTLTGIDGELLTWSSAGVPATVAAGSSAQVLTSNGAGLAPTFQAAAGGSPGGSDTQVQYNNGGAFGGMVGVTWDDSAEEISFVNSINGLDATGTDTVAGNLTLAPGQSTGNAAPASVIIRGTVAGSTGTTPQPLIDIFTVGVGGGDITMNPPTGANVNLKRGGVLVQEYGTGDVVIIRGAEHVTGQLHLGKVGQAGRLKFVDVGGGNAASIGYKDNVGKALLIESRSGSGNIIFEPNFAEAMRCATTQDVLIGTATTPGSGGKALMFGDNAGDPTAGANTAGMYAKDIASANVTPFAVDEADNVQPLVPFAEAVMLGSAVTTFVADANLVTVTGDGGANTIATITGARAFAGSRVVLLFVDALVTITDDDTHAANSVDLSAAFTSADDTILEIIHNGTSWYEINRSVN